MTAQIGQLQLMPIDMLIFFNKFYLHRNSFTNFICTGIVIFALKTIIISIFARNIGLSVNNKNMYTYVILI